MLKCALLVLLTMFSLNVFAENTPIGYWKTIDDVTGRTQSIIKIFATADHTLSGTLVKVFPEPGVLPLQYCTACKDSRRNKPILGLTIMTGLKPTKGNQWMDGRILDPTDGKIYHCAIQPVENGQKLTVRGYIGIPLFGRSQTWFQAEKPS